jgi:hypothetical protein
MRMNLTFFLSISFESSWDWEWKTVAWKAMGERYENFGERKLEINKIFRES